MGKLIKFNTHTARGLFKKIPDIKKGAFFMHLLEPGLTL